MFDFGLSKLVLIGVIALVVIGPEKLPKVARMAGALFGRAQRYINDVRAEVSREMAFDELHRLHGEVRVAAQEIGDSLSNLQSQAGATPAASERKAGAFSSKAREFRRNKVARASQRAARRSRGKPFSTFR
ncbi:MAG: tatB [Burkholderiaceae bacterium]|nr:tatB [Burkholderiaceae bacterium]